MLRRRLLVFAIAVSAWGQTAGEVDTHDVPVTFESRVNLVLVPVVVRDKGGKPIGNLTKDDFRLFDKGKPQEIVKFSLEKAGARTAPVIQQLDSPLEEKTERPGVAVADHFSVWLFDDIHGEFGDLKYVKDAAVKALAGLTPNDRVGIATTSGRVALDLSDDREQLRAAIERIQPQPTRSRTQECPDISYYMADLIRNKEDRLATAAAIQEALRCPQAPPGGGAAAWAEMQVRSNAQMAIVDGERETRFALIALKNMVRALAAMPGQRAIVLASPGFLVLDDVRSELSEVLELAIKNNVVIGALDARGLYTGMVDASKRVFDVQAELQKSQYSRFSDSSMQQTLAELADGTGGRHFENTNNLNGAFRNLAATPEFYYVLGFSVQSLKLDGSYHLIKVTVKEPKGLTVTARRGYFAPKKLMNADEQAKEEIGQALYSRDELKGFPIEMRSQFYKANDTQAHLAIVSRMQIKGLHYRKVEGRNGDEITVVAGLFDRYGNYLQGSSKLVTLRLKDETLEKRATIPIAVRNEFQVGPGTYIVRVVARDAEGQQMAALNGAVEIP